jgi:threonine dehydrogenase-like Zn-dependent dehydrogenase
MWCVRALSLSEPRAAAIVTVADPVPGAGQVLVRVGACGVCGSDLNAWRGVPGIQYPLSPGAPGHEVWGEVAALGSDVETVRIGDRVTGLMWNGLAELCLAEARNLVQVPGRFNGEIVLGEPLACAMNVVHRSGLRAGDRVCVVGFGYLAALIVQLLPPETDAWVAVSRRQDSRDLAMRLGADAAYDFGNVPAELWDSFPVVIEAAGVQQTLDHATWLTGYGGRLVIAGYHADGPRTVNMQSWNWKGLDVINAHERRAAVYVAALGEALERLATRPEIDLAALQTHRLPLARAAEAFELGERRPAGFVKAVVCP